MKKYPIFISFLAVSLFAVPGAQTVEIDATKKQVLKNSRTMTVFGMIKEVEGEVVTILDPKGQEWKIQVDQNTDKIGKVFLPGFVITAQVDGNGHAKEVKILGNS